MNIKVGEWVDIPEQDTEYNEFCKDWHWYGQPIIEDDEIIQLEFEDKVVELRPSNLAGVCDDCFGAHKGKPIKYRVLQIGGQTGKGVSKGKPMIDYKGWKIPDYNEQVHPGWWEQFVKRVIDELERIKECGK